MELKYCTFALNDSKYNYSKTLVRQGVHNTNCTSSSTYWAQNIRGSVYSGYTLHAMSHTQRSCPIRNHFKISYAMNDKLYFDT